MSRVLTYMSNTMETGFASVDEALDSIEQYTSHRSRQRNHDSVFKNLRLAENGRYYWHWDPAFMQMSWEGDENDQGGRKLQDSMLEHTLRIQSPLLLISGRSSDLVTKETVDTFLKHVPHSKHVSIRDAAHMVAGDSNDAFTQALVDFIHELDLPQSRL